LLGGVLCRSLVAVKVRLIDVYTVYHHCAKKQQKRWFDPFLMNTVSKPPQLFTRSPERCNCSTPRTLMESFA
jgi:hypothetical protein